MIEVELDGPQMIHTPGAARAHRKVVKMIEGGIRDHGPSAVQDVAMGLLTGLVVTIVQTTETRQRAEDIAAELAGLLIVMVQRNHDIIKGTLAAHSEMKRVFGSED